MRIMQVFGNILRWLFGLSGVVGDWVSEESVGYLGWLKL